MCRAVFPHPLRWGPDHNDVLAARDTGFIQIHVETCQEVLDSVLMAFRIAEDSRVSLPTLVNLDGFFLSFTREPVEIPDAKLVQEFLPAFRPHHPVFKGSQSVAQGVAVLDGAAYSYFRYQMHRAVENAQEVHEEVAEEFYRLFGRRYKALEEYRMEDARDRPGDGRVFFHQREIRRESLAGTGTKSGFSPVASHSTPTGCRAGPVSGRPKGGRCD